MKGKFWQSDSSVDNKIGWDIVLFFFLYVIAPDYCAIELSSNLPLITLSRAVLVGMFLAMLFRHRKNYLPLGKGLVRYLNFGLSDNLWLRCGLFLYFVLLMACHLALLPSNTGEALKAIAVLLAECYALVWILSLVLDTREKIKAALRVLVLASGVTAVVAAVGCVLDCNPFHALNFVQRDMRMNFEYRLGILRAAASFRHPCYYGAFCTIISPINMYFVEYSEKKWEKKLYALCLALNITGIVLSNARGSFVTFAGLVLIAAVWNLKHRNFKRFVYTYLPIGLLAIIILLIVSMLSPVGPVFLWGVVKSVLHIVFPDISMDVVVNTPVAGIVEETVDSAVNVISYGKNRGGGYSRWRQLTGIEWTLTQKPWFGFGSNAHTAGLISYQYTKDMWQTSRTFDVGIVAIICQYGLVGLIGYMALFGATLKACLSKVCFGDPLMRFLCFAIVIYLLHLLTISSLDKMLWVLVASIVCLSNVIHKEALQKE